MKVLFIVRSTLDSNKGGDTIQIRETARHLNKLGVEVTVSGTGEVSSYEEYDLLHFFNITRPADILGHIRKSGKPFVLSPIFVDYSEFDRKFRRGVSGLALRFLGINGIEYAKTVGRFLLKRERLGTFSYLFYGQKNSIRKILRQASMLLPNSNSEYRRLVTKYGIEKRFSVVRNGVGELFLRPLSPAPPRDPLLVLCVARIEGLKNQLNLIKALNNSRFSLVLIGQAATNQPAYFRHCQKTAASNVRFVGHLPQSELLRYYSRATVHILPSWFETTGLSSLEAAAMGCHLVITDKGDAPEYFGRSAWYCDPASPSSILAAVEAAAAGQSDGALQERITSEYTWAAAAAGTMAAYEDVLLHLNEKA